MNAIHITSSSLPDLESEHLDRIRMGILAFPVSAILIFGSLFLRGPLVDPPTDPVLFARNAVAPTFATGAYGILLAWVILILGLPALYAFLQSSRLGRWGFSGMVFSVLGVGLFLPLLGLVAVAFPEVGGAYMRGEEMVMVLTALGFTSNMSLLALFVLAIILHTLGSIFFAIGVLRCPLLPTWAGFLYALHAPLIHFSPNYLMEFIGTGLLLVSGAVFSYCIWKRISVLHRFGDALQARDRAAPGMGPPEEDDEDFDEDIPPWERKKRKAEAEEEARSEDEDQGEEDDPIPPWERKKRKAALEKLRSQDKDKNKKDHEA
jgi:hypothetical protein